jgi:pyruvate/2-oxoglutarate dehydrogenase complex dihydrolipoamide dehydrogenase (E3) component
MKKQYDAIILGAGQAAPPLAARLAGKEGLKTALIEMSELGGSCVNEGCTPTKTMIASARAAHMARRGADFGVQTGAVQVDMQVVNRRVVERIEASRGGLSGWLGSFEKLDILRGRGQFEGPNTIRVGDELLEAPRIFINTGTRPRGGIDGLESVPYLTNREILQLTEIPEHLVVVGGSYIGLEFAQAFRRFGSQVTVVDRRKRLLGREDADISDWIRKIMENEGIAVRTASECIKIMPHPTGVKIGLECAASDKQVVGTHLLVAVGRQPNSDGIGLEKAGIASNPQGYITVDERLETNIPGVWALGDVNGRGAFTHTSWNDFEIVEDILFGSDTRRVSDRFMTYGLFIDPPLGRVGMTEQQARATGRRVLVGVKQMAHIGRARERDEIQGMIKVLVDAESDRFLGAAVLGIGGDEIIGSITNLMYADISCREFRKSVHVHPTVTELLPFILDELVSLE